MQGRFYHKSLRLWLLLICIILPVSHAHADDLSLDSLIEEALAGNHEILAYGQRVSASKFRIPQSGSLPDPMFMFGYQNEGWDKYTFGKMADAQWMYSLSQMFPFPGKLSLKGEMASKDSESMEASYGQLKLKTIAAVKELYYDLFLAWKGIDILSEKAFLFKRIEDAALSRYSSGTGGQQEVVMAQTEKYMLLEKQKMLGQKIETDEAMLNSTVGRDINSPLGRPVEPAYEPYGLSLEWLISTAHNNSPEIKSRLKMVEALDAKVRMAKKEYYPDFTITASLFERSGGFEDMWSLTTSVNIPIFYKTKQKMAVLEAEASLSEARHEIEGLKYMISSSIRENYSMLKTSGELMELYKNGLAAKAHLDFELSMTGYLTGRVEALTVVSRLRNLLDYELSFYEQLVSCMKARARIEALTGAADK
jgi:outer membrane protein TolC